MKNSINNTKSSVFLDTNILLEIIFEWKNQKSSRRIIVENYGALFISALTAHSVVYFSRNILSLGEAHTFLKDFNILPLEEDNFDWAFINSKNKDFEDALQIATAIKHDQKTFYTYDKTLYKSYKDIKIIEVKLVTWTNWVMLKIQKQQKEYDLLIEHLHWAEPSLLRDCVHTILLSMQSKSVPAIALILFHGQDAIRDRIKAYPNDQLLSVFPKYSDNTNAGKLTPEQLAEIKTTLGAVLPYQGYWLIHTTCIQCMLWVMYY